MLSHCAIADHMSTWLGNWRVIQKSWQISQADNAPSISLSHEVRTLTFISQVLALTSETFPRIVFRSWWTRISIEGHSPMATYNPIRINRVNEYWENIGKPSRLQVNQQDRVSLKVWLQQILTWVLSRDSSARSSSKPRPNPRMKTRRKKMTPNLLRRRRPRAKTRKSRRTRRKMTKRRKMTQIKNRGCTEETKMACTRTIRIT